MKTFGLTKENFQTLSGLTAFELSRNRDGINAMSDYIGSIFQFGMRVLSEDGVSAVAQTGSSRISVSPRVVVMALMGAVHPMVIYDIAEEILNVPALQAAANDFASKLEEITQGLTLAPEDDAWVPPETLLSFEFLKDFATKMFIYIRLFSAFIDRDRVRAQAAVGNLMQGLVHITTAAELAAAEQSED